MSTSQRRSCSPQRARRMRRATTKSEFDAPTGVAACGVRPAHGGQKRRTERRAVSQATSRIMTASARCRGLQASTREDPTDATPTQTERSVRTHGRNETAAGRECRTYDLKRHIAFALPQARTAKRRNGRKRRLLLSGATRVRLGSLCIGGEACRRRRPPFNPQTTNAARRTGRRSKINWRPARNGPERPQLERLPRCWPRPIFLASSERAAA